MNGGRMASQLPQTLARHRYKLAERKKDRAFVRTCADLAAERKAEREARAEEIVAALLPDYNELPLGRRGSPAPASERR